MLTNKGFTLIETLFVLFIICMLFTISLTLHMPSKNIQTEINSIQAFINDAKMQAMISKKTVEVEFVHDMIYYRYSSIEKKYQLIKGTYFDNYKMTFNGNGNIKTAKTLIFHTMNKNYSFVFQIGSGSFYVQS